ncbi:MAG: hypothetical protein AAF959_02155 [Cyanobacteria bacterium P01_D01_bin.56]
MANLSKLNEGIELDLDAFGENPMLLGRVLDDPLHLLLGGGLLSMFALAAPGAGWILAAGIAFSTANDIKWALLEDEGDEFDGDTVETDAVEVVDPIERLKKVSPDNWVDKAIADGFNVMPSSRSEQWPPATGQTFEQVRDYFLGAGPDALVQSLPDELVPAWLMNAADEQRAAVSAHAQRRAAAGSGALPRESLAVTNGDTPSVTPVTPKSDSKVTASDTLINGFAQNYQSNACHRQSQQGSDTSPVTPEDCETYVSGLTLSEFKSQLCPEGGGLNPQDLNAKEGRVTAVQHLREFRASYGRTPVEFAVWWGWGLTKKGGSSPGAEKYRFVANFVADAFNKLWSD